MNDICTVAGELAGAMLTAHNCWCNFGRGHYEEHIFEIIII